MIRTRHRRNWIYILLALGALAWLGGCGSGSRYDAPKAAQAGNQPAGGSLERMPDFDLKDTSGHEVSWSQFRGKVVLVDFWATWCVPCKTEMPGYERLYREYKDQGFAVVGIAADSNPKVIAKFAKELGITYPLLVNGMDVGRYGILGLPTTILVDRNGFIRKKVVGFEYTQVFESALRQIL